LQEHQYVVSSERNAVMEIKGRYLSPQEGYCMGLFGIFVEEVECRENEINLKGKVRKRTSVNGR